MIQRIRDMFYGVREDLRKLTSVVFWSTIGSLSTMYVVAPTAPLTAKLLPLELGLLLGMGLVYISQDTHREPHPRILGNYTQEDLH
jgi:hypothetical protein